MAAPEPAADEPEPPAEIDDEKVLLEAATILKMPEVDEDLRENYAQWLGNNPKKTGEDFLIGLRGE